MINIALINNEGTNQRLFKRLEKLSGNPVYISVPDWAKNLTPAVVDSKYAYKIIKKGLESYLKVSSKAKDSQRHKIMIRTDAPDPRQRNNIGEVRRGKPSITGRS